MSQLHADEPVCQKLLFYAMIFSLFPILLATQKATRAPKMWEVQTLVHGYLTTCVCALRDCACEPAHVSERLSPHYMVPCFAHYIRPAARPSVVFCNTILLYSCACSLAYMGLSITTNAEEEEEEEEEDDNDKAD